MATDENESFGLFEILREDWEVTGRDWTKPGFRALAVYRFGVWRMRIRTRLIRAPLSVIYRMLYRYVRNHYGIMVSYTAKLGRRVHIAHQHGITIHPNAHIGSDCIIRHNVTIGVATLERIWDPPPRLEKGVEVGVGATIIGAVTIGEGARIGPNTVITTDIPAGATVFSPPPKIMRQRKSELHEQEPDVEGKPGPGCSEKL